MSALDPMYRTARESARELITLILYAESLGADPDGHDIRGQVRQVVNGNTPAQNWLLVEVLCRSVAATYDDLDDWSASVVQAVAQEPDDEPCQHHWLYQPERDGQRCALCGAES